MSLSPISIGTTTLRAPYLGVGAEPSRWGHPSRVVWRLSAHSFGTKASSIHLSLVALRWGHPMGRVWFFSHSIATKSSLVIWSVFLQDGVTLFGSGSIDLISSEGNSSSWALGCVFPACPRGEFLSSFGRPIGSEAGRVPLSVVFASGENSVCVPLADDGVGLGPSSSSDPVASRSPLADRSASAAFSTSGGWVALFWSACHLRWATWGGCRAQGRSFSRPCMAKFADFLLWLPRSQGFRFSSIRSYRLMLSYRFTLSFGPSAPFGCLPLAGLFALLLGPLRCFFAIYLPRRSHRLSRWFSSLWP